MGIQSAELQLPSYDTKNTIAITEEGTPSPEFVKWIVYLTDPESQTGQQQKDAYAKRGDVLRLVEQNRVPELKKLYTPIWEAIEHRRKNPVNHTDAQFARHLDCLDMAGLKENATKLDITEPKQDLLGLKTQIQREF